jgi:hypothetical protein
MTRTWIFGVASAAALLLSSALAQEGSQGTATFRNAAIDDGEPPLWVNGDWAGQAAGPAMSAMPR